MAKHILIILSDLHLSAVQNAEDDHPVAYEGFHYDVAFSHFIDYLIGHLKREAAAGEILLLGDFLDFLHTKVPLTASNFLITTEGSSLQKLQAILRAHPLFFEAVQRFVSEGFRLSIVPGNHDIDLMRPEVQRALKQSVKTELQSKVHFHSWIYHVPGVLYAEHGHQYHDIMAYTTLLAPFRTGNEKELELPIGAYFDLYLFHLIERLGPPVGNIEAPLRHLLHRYRSRPVQLLTTLPDLCKFIYTISRQLAFRSSRGFRRTRQRYQEQILLRYAASIGISHSTCVALDQLAEVNNSKMIKRLLGQALFKNGGDPIKTGSLYPKARMISRILSAENKDVPFYVFGHSHRPAKVDLEGQHGRFYLNAGSWSSPGYPGSPGDRSLFPFVEVRWEDHQHPAATLMQWDEAKQEPVPLKDG